MTEGLLVQLQNLLLKDLLIVLHLSRLVEQVTVLVYLEHVRLDAAANHVLVTGDAELYLYD